jgi:hypothetical protein
MGAGPWETSTASRGKVEREMTKPRKIARHHFEMFLCSIRVSPFRFSQSSPQERGWSVECRNRTCLAGCHRQVGWMARPSKMMVPLCPDIETGRKWNLLAKADAVIISAFPESPALKGRAFCTLADHELPFSVVTFEPVHLGRFQEKTNPEKNLQR